MYQGADQKVLATYVSIENRRGPGAETACFASDAIGTCVRAWVRPACSLTFGDAALGEVVVVVVGG